MVSNAISTLVQTLSCEFMMADVNEPETLSGLLPFLKKLHTQCMKESFKAQARQLLQARNLITAILDDPDNSKERMTALGDVISGIADSLDIPGDSNECVAVVEEAKAGLAVDAAVLELEQALNAFERLMGEICPDNAGDQGALLACLDETISVSDRIEPQTFHDIAVACKSYVEGLKPEHLHHTHPVEETLLLLKSILSHLKRGEAFTFDYSDVLDLLHAHFSDELEAGPEPEPETPSEPDAPAEPAPLSGDDLEIMADFVSEAEENLDAIEVKLIDLETDPDNKDIINEIFRPFHTIKGVSGFLSLKKIHALSHTTENLLDSARSGDFIINETAVDGILKSVDTLKKLVARVRESVGAGVKLPNDDIPVDELKNSLQQLRVSLAKGERMPLGEILVQKKVVDPEGLEQALETQKASPDRKLGDILVEDQKVPPKKVASALMAQAPTKKQVDSQVKVNTQKLDDLVDYAGELVIAQSMLKQKTVDDPSLLQNVSQLGIIVTKMQNIAMSMRMIPIKATFMKMIRLVRDLSRKTGKDVALDMYGEETEIDRNVVDALYEPMVHMIRNAVDHGIEPDKQRSAVGKPAQGKIILRAYHKGGHIVIEIEDDGKGLDRDKILAKAQSTGLVTGKEQMTDAQVFDLILQPGFSTAQSITDVSGRGVGMDVVKDGIEKFRGDLSIDSAKGRGTRFTISLPLTLAIIDGMLVRVGKEKYVIPTTAVQKAFKPEKEEYYTVEGKGELVKDRGSLVPLVRLGEIYDAGVEADKPVWDSLVVVVESKGDKRALLIDELLGKDEYVIKSLGGSLENVKGLAGGAILGDGRVGLILDIHGIFTIDTNHEGS